MASEHPSPQQQTAADGAARARDKALLVVLYVGAFVAAFNENLVNTALVHIMDEFQVGTGTAQWLVTGYMVVTATMVTLMGWAYNRFDTRRLLCGALGLFALGEAGGIAAPTFGLLLAARLVQALGTGVLITVMMSSVLVLAPRERLGTYLSVGSCMIVFGPAFAPVVSGAITTYLGWRLIFVPPLVVALALLASGLVLGRNLGARRRTPVDAASVVLSAAALLGVSWGLGELTGRTALGVAGVAAGAVLGVLFALRQTRLQNPLLDVRLLKGAGFWPACVLTMVCMMTSFSMSVLLPLYFEGSLGTSAFTAGLLLLVPILLNALASLVGGRVLDGHGPWPLVPAGFALMTAGLAAVALGAPQLGTGVVLTASSVTYVGVGLGMSPSQTCGLATLQGPQHADGVALVNTFVQVAACVGPALFTGVLSSGTAAALAEGAGAAAANARGFSEAVWVAAAIAAAGLALSVVYARHQARRA